MTSHTRRRATGTHLHSRVVLEEKENHALVQAVEPVVHCVVEAHGQRRGEQAPGGPRQQVRRRGAQHDGGGEPIPQRVGVYDEGQQHGGAVGAQARLPAQHSLEIDEETLQIEAMGSLCTRGGGSSPGLPRVLVPTYFRPPHLPLGEHTVSSGVCVCGRTN